jgi:hypothetical protein
VLAGYTDADRRDHLDNMSGIADDVDIESGRPRARGAELLVQLVTQLHRIHSGRAQPRAALRVMLERRDPEAIVLKGPHDELDGSVVGRMPRPWIGVAKRNIPVVSLRRGRRTAMLTAATADQPVRMRIITYVILPSAR